MPGIPPNALSDLKAKLKNLLKGKKSKKAEDKPAETTKTEQPATNGATATEAAPPVPAVVATTETPAPAPAAEPAAEPAKTEVAGEYTRLDSRIV
ncbi:hypothetical protein F5882DRAFT_107446 [Hyaloscypha sp. PMI_1271]|nr:hypothetical protein F5882DRAFT_107446 [Hyaloscypha sp. PMI_1271]